VLEYFNHFILFNWELI